MNIDLSRIDPNPHRDLTRNPLEPEQISHVAASIGRTGFWENVVVREHPDQPDRYQLAYGHNRLEALRQRGEQSAEFIVKPLSDYDMLVAMIDENATQRNQTVRIVFENITAAIRLGEHLLLSTDTVEQFNERARPTRCASQHNGQSAPPWRADEYAKAKECIASGEGLGRGFLQHFLPDGISYADHTIQSTLDSYYVESRKAAAIAEAQRAADEARRLEEEAKADEERAATAPTAKERQRATGAAVQKKSRAAKARKTARKASAKAAEIDYRGFDRDLLERLPSASHMQELVQLARREKIPSEYHDKLVQACLDGGWTSGGGRSNQVPHTILNAGKVWWFKTSGRAEQQRKEAHREAIKWKHREKSLDEFARKTLTDMKDLVKALDAIKPFADQIENETLITSLDAQLAAVLSVAQAVRENLSRPENVVPIDLKRLSND